MRNVNDLMQTFHGVRVGSFYFDVPTSNEPGDARLIAAAPDLLSDLIEAAETLRKYECLHRAKNTEESTTKAEVNAALAGRFEKTIAKARGES
jgi:hypothetical protein